MNLVGKIENNYAFLMILTFSLCHILSVPEVISLPITGGNLKYLEWIKDSTRD